MAKKTTITELIKALQDYEEMYPDAEVKIGLSQTYTPMECPIFDMGIFPEDGAFWIATSATEYAPRAVFEGGLE